MHHYVWLNGPISDVSCETTEHMLKWDDCGARYGSSESFLNITVIKQSILKHYIRNTVAGIFGAEVVRSV